jgi:hypothetical protein
MRAGGALFGDREVRPNQFEDEILIAGRLGRDRRGHANRVGQQEEDRPGVAKGDAFGTDVDAEVVVACLRGDELG